jgi:DNA-binding MarR family transcriptional regulator
VRGKNAPVEQTARSFDDWTDLRYHLHRLLRVREEAARAAGLEPQQYLLLLQVKVMQGRQPPTIGALAERLQLRHQSTVELIDWLVDRGILARRPVGRDRSEVLVELRSPGETILKRLERYSQRELETEGTARVSSLQRVNGSSQAGKHRTTSKRVPACNTISGRRPDIPRGLSGERGPGL